MKHPSRSWNCLASHAAKRAGTHQQMQPKHSGTDDGDTTNWSPEAVAAQSSVLALRATPPASHPALPKIKVVVCPHHRFCRGFWVARWVFTHRGSCRTTGDTWHSKTSECCCGQIWATWFMPDEMPAKPVNGFFNKLGLAEVYTWPMWHVSKVLYSYMKNPHIKSHLLCAWTTVSVRN